MKRKMERFSPEGDIPPRFEGKGILINRKPTSNSWKEGGGSKLPSRLGSVFYMFKNICSTYNKI